MGRGISTNSNALNFYNSPGRVPPPGYHNVLIDATAIPALRLQQYRHLKGWGILIASRARQLQLSTSTRSTRCRQHALTLSAQGYGPFDHIFLLHNVVSQPGMSLFELVSWAIMRQHRRYYEHFRPDIRSRGL